MVVPDKAVQRASGRVSGGGATGLPADGARRRRHRGRHGHAVHAPAPAALARQLALLLRAHGAGRGQVKPRPAPRVTFPSRPRRWGGVEPASDLFIVFSLRERI